MAVASLVLGIIGFLCSIFGSPAGASWLGSVCGILAIVFGALGMKDSNNKGKAQAGLILGVLSFVSGILFTILCASCISVGGLSIFSILSDNL